MSDVSDKAMDAGYRLVTSNGFSSAFNATLGRSGVIKRGMANLGAVAALRSGVTTADKRRRSEGPTSSLGGKSLKWDTMTDKSRVQTEAERRLYGDTEFEKRIRHDEYAHAHQKQRNGSDRVHQHRDT